MRNRILRATFCAVAVTAIGAPAQGLVPAEGQPFPEIVFPTVDGGAASLKDFRGEKVLLLQFASW